VRGAWLGLRASAPPDMNLLIGLGTLAAYSYSVGGDGGAARVPWRPASNRHVYFDDRPR
jgi:hypothetical protein